MASALSRLNAVIAALEKVHEHVSNLADDEDVNVSTYNRWIGILDGVVDGNWKSLVLEGDTIPASEMLMHAERPSPF